MAVVRSLVAAALALAACSQTRESPPSPPPPSALVAAPAPSAAAPPPSAAAPPSVAAPAPVAAPSPCADASAVAFFVSPATPVAGQPLRILALADGVRAGELRAGALTTRDAHGGPPWFWTLELAEAPAGAVVATFDQPGCVGTAPAVAKHAIDVHPARSSSIAAPAQGVWRTRSAWTHTLENVYSAWIETLFDAPETEIPSWPALHEVLRDPKRNLLFDHLGAAEDSGKSAPFLRPDCADLPYFLRAYFAWKLRLPFGVSECGRGGHGYPPSCHGLFTNEDPDERADGKRESGGVAMFGAFVAGTVANKAHSGSARTPFEDEASDYYPVKLTWESLRPGTVYADPYGHVLVVAKRVPESASGDRGGVLYAVDGQPDGTVSRKRFWRGNFLYAHKRELGGPGFKHFRPLARRGGHLARLDDDAISRSPEYGDLSREAGALDVEAFYDAMDEVLSPRPLDPTRALLETIDALEEQVRTRVQSVDNGRKWLEKNRAPAPMPDGPEIFETSGAWEDFATPSRDLRLLIAIDVARGFPARVGRRPERYAIPRGKSPQDVEAELAAVLARTLDARTVTYTRSDGSSLTLRLVDVIDRSAAYETAYNLNDCVETRWGALPGSGEASTCRAHAPPEQISRMETYRAWFHDRRRPPRR